MTVWLHKILFYVVQNNYITKPGRTYHMYCTQSKAVPPHAMEAIGGEEV
jgi:hypothetical protein